MTTPARTERTDPPLAADEATTLVAFLDYHRDTLRLKTEGLTAEQLAQPLTPSTLTLGALLKHVALNEASWFGEVLHGRAMPEPWASADWDADPDWEMTSARDDSPEELRRIMDESVDQQFTLRWILLHMIEENARHNGHADFLREAVDGVTGE